MLQKEEIYKNAPFADLKASKGSGRIRIYTYAYEYPNADSGNDADWYMNYISLRINGLTAGIDEPLIEGSSFERLLKEVEMFRAGTVSEVDFSFIEPGLAFTLKRGESENAILVQGEMLDTQIQSEVHIDYQFQTNIESLDRFILGMRKILKEFPSRL